MKTIFTICALAVLLLALNLQAQTTVAWRGANNNPTNLFWNVTNNWSPARVPSAIGTNVLGDKASFNNNAQPPCFVNSLAFPSQFVMGDGNPSSVYIFSGGSLTTSNYSGVNSWNALGYSQIARMEIRNGGSLISSNHLWVGQNFGGRGNLVINGGTATVLGMFGLGYSGAPSAGIGIAQVNGGTLNLAQWNDTQSIGPSSQLDIRAGTIYITNDHSASIANYIAGGQITGYGGVGTVSYSVVSDSVSTQTVLTATCPPGAGGPYPVTNGQPFVETTFPTNINPNLFVHYWAMDPPSTPPNANWINSLGVVAAASGDQWTKDVTFQGLHGLQAQTTPNGNINVYDQNWHDWNTNGLIDILLCVYGDANVLRSATDANQTRRFQFLTGTLPTDGSSTVYGSSIIPTNAFNSRWNWMMFTITNNLQSNLVDRLVGTLRTNATGATTYGGINGGTIRMQSLDNSVYGLTVRAVAFGQHGAFGTAPDINQFLAPDGACPMVLDANLAAIDYNAGYTNHLQAIDDPGTGQGVTFASDVGPTNDLRKAVIPTGSFLNFGIVSNYLGQPCNDNVTMKVCVDYYDDPALAGAAFGPYTYATDSLGDIGYLSSFATLQGSGQWVHQSWVIPSVNLMGVSTAPLTGGPQFYCSSPVAVSRFYLAVLRTSGPLGGQDPLADCYQDPNVCTGAYGNYAELDLANGVTNGVDVGSSGGDQAEVIEMAGPVNDQRLSVRSDSAPNYYLNFQILTNALGPVTEGNVYLTTTVTYYDDPALAGQGFRPEVWTLQLFGAASQAHMSNTRNIVLQGTGKWRDAYWEIGAISFDGINQHPAAARFTMGAPIHISRIRYAVIRPCGATAGQNLLSNPVSLAAAPDTNSLMRVSWPYRAPQAALQSISAFGGTWSPFAGTPVIEGGEQSVLRFGPTNFNNQFFRLSITPQ